MCDPFVCTGETVNKKKSPEYVIEGSSVKSSPGTVCVRAVCVRAVCVCVCMYVFIDVCVCVCVCVCVHRVCLSAVLFAGTQAQGTCIYTLTHTHTCLYIQV